MELAHWEQSLRTAETAGVHVSWGSASDLPEFYRLYAATAAHDGFKARPLDYFQRMWKALGKVLQRALGVYLGRR
ncbi:aminoacyltransferase [Streptomyces sp. SLBN-118]|uniref:aminoacyltransferase n=1 Tax=Streptomyces sp. SLBN-118 TaxID=2768454 RepID=UPI0021B39DF1|nr:aminoacyltransferase [Streptomyces sp. SLBN-118]